MFRLWRDKHGSGCYMLNWMDDVLNAVLNDVLDSVCMRCCVHEVLRAWCAACVVRCVNEVLRA